MADELSNTCSFVSVRPKEITWTKADWISIRPSSSHLMEIVIKILVHENAFENIICKMPPEVNELNQKKSER